ncbi:MULTISPECIES: TetR/AcrR family transcriptional regulator [Pseudonocardia]|uniref:Tetracycline repressor protein class H n=1 Tax=Pseudonocardia autotrophica TaxID=2074 RepID=A0A1Y2N8B8_PSEAH|nr:MULTISPECIES: TetR family transcriptional regulator [Pseudonocardia]OSY43327.1 Tetracycline repressor protein class H [Pseudonocardia autotrophica]TDN71814.1 TetR family transcriptional regulator [Pseudonocardia autotrophica]
MNRPETPLTRARVIATANDLAGAEGLRAVTVRRVATELQVTPMALYWHVRGKDELLDGMAESALDRVDPGVDPALPWPGGIRSLLGSILRSLCRDPIAAGLLTTRTITSEHGLEITESLLDLLRRGGFAPGPATQVARHAIASLAALAAGGSGVVVREPDGPSPERRRARERLEALPVRRYPRLVEAAGPLSEGVEREAYLALGLELLVAGIVATAPEGGDPS